MQFNDENDNNPRGIVGLELLYSSVVVGDEFGDCVCFLLLSSFDDNDDGEGNVEKDDEYDRLVLILPKRLFSL